MAQHSESRRGEDLLVQVINQQAIPGEGVLVRLVESALSVCSGQSQQYPASLEAESDTVALGICFVWDVFRGNASQSVLPCLHVLER